jgi:DNA-binding XRE family transcriptional regulator
MNTAEAVLQLRREFGETQPTFAKTLGVSFRSLCRYEAGGEPNPKALKRLIELSDQKNAPHLKNMFVAMQQGEIVSRVKRVTSGRSRVRVEIRDLSRWARVQGEVFYLLDKARGMKWDAAKGLLNEAACMVDSVKDQMEPYLTAPDFEQLERLRQFDVATVQRVQMDGTVDSDATHPPST